MTMHKRLTYLLGSIAFAVFTLLSSSPVVHANSYQGGNWKLTFYSPVSHTNSAQEVYTVNPDGSDLQRITNNSVQDANPQWSPNMSSRKLAINRDTDATAGEDWGLFVQNVTSAGAVTGSASAFSGASVADVNEWDPSWSPDETKIAFHRQTSGDTGPNHIHTIATSGSPTATAITSGANYQDTEPTWSKDGSWLVFTRTDNKGTTNDDTDDTTSIVAVPSSGNESGTVVVDTVDGAGSPQWSPTSNTVVYQKNGDIYTVNLGDSFEQLASPNVSTVNDDGVSVTATNAVPTKLTTSPAIPYAPTFSPDGKIIAASGNAGIAFYDATTGALITTTTIASNSSLGFDAANGIHEVDWARQNALENTVHECTTTVNVPCTDGNFTPNIPDACSTGLQSAITTAAQHGDPSYADGNFTFTPATDYVGTDQYVYTYYDQYMNSITCTVNITVLPNAPDTGLSPKASPLLFGAVGVGVLAIGLVLRRRMN